MIIIIIIVNNNIINQCKIIFEVFLDYVIFYLKNMR